MTPGYLAYKTLVSLLCLKVLPLFLLYSRISGRYYRQFGERMGYVRSSVRDVDENPVSFWVHAVSLGEVKVAASIVDALKIRFPDARFVISTFTEHGRRLAEETFGLGIPVIYAPLDVPWAVGRALDTIRPKAMVFLETELWPTWIMETKSRHIKTIIANGRISSRSVGRYRIIRPMLREVLSGIDAFSMIGDTDAERIIYLGASREKVSVNGNAKYDLLSRAVDSDSESDVRRTLKLKPQTPVVVAGSTRGREDDMIVGCYLRIRESIPSCILILAPRHITRTQSIASMIRNNKLEYQLWSDISTGKEERTKPVVIVDTFGELFNIYSAASVAFCGGSLVPMGGQNPMEPAAWGKPVFYGPSMEDFAEAKEILEKEGGSMQIASPDILGEKIIWYLEHPRELEKMGEAARRAVISHSGAAHRHAALIAKVLEE